MPAHFALGFAPTEVTAPKIFQVRRMDRPVVTLAISAPARLNKAIVQREIVSDRVAPTRPTGAEIRVVLKDMLVDIGQHELLLRR